MNNTFLRSLFTAIALLGASVALSAADEKPMPIRTQVPAYPAELKDEGVEGAVVLKVMINEAGEVTGCEVVNSTDPRFNKAAQEAISKWRFKPAKKDNAPVASSVAIPVRFNAES